MVQQLETLLLECVQHGGCVDHSLSSTTRPCKAKYLSGSCEAMSENRTCSSGPCLIRWARLWTWVILLGWWLWWVQNLLQAPCQVTATCSMVSSVVIMLFGTVTAEMCDVSADGR